MKRLTFTKEERIEHGVGYLTYLSPEKMKIFDKRLSEYEDTGLTPDEIMQLKKLALGGDTNDCIGCSKDSNA